MTGHQFRLKMSAVIMFHQSVLIFVFFLLSNSKRHSYVATNGLCDWSRFIIVNVPNKSFSKRLQNYYCKNASAKIYRFKCSTGQKWCEFSLDSTSRHNQYQCMSRIAWKQCKDFGTCFSICLIFFRKITIIISSFSFCNRSNVRVYRIDFYWNQL